MCFGFQITWIEYTGKAKKEHVRDIQDADSLISLCKEWDVIEEDLPKGLLRAKGVCLCPVSPKDIDILIGKIVGAMLRSFYKVELSWL